MQIIETAFAECPAIEKVHGRIDMDALRIELALPDGRVAKADYRLTDIFPALLQENTLARDFIEKAIAGTGTDSEAAEELIRESCVAFCKTKGKGYAPGGAVTRGVATVTDRADQSFRLSFESPIFRCTPLRDDGERFHYADLGSYDENLVYTNLVSGYFDSLEEDDALTMHLRLRKGIPAIRRGFRAEIATDRESVALTGDESGEIELTGDLAPLTSAFREIAATVAGMAKVSQRIIRVFRTIRDENGRVLATCEVEAPYYLPDPDSKASSVLEAACEGLPVDDEEQAVA